MSLRVFISDSTAGGTHGTDLKAAISFGYGSDISAEITLRLNGSYSSAQILADMAEAYDAGYIAFVQSAFGPNAFIAAARDYQSTMQMFSPLGSNSSTLLSTPDPVPGIVTSGAGDTDNDTAYGPGLEFWDDDNDGNMNNDASSFSNGTVCGKILKIYDSRGRGWWDARRSARKTASGGGVRTDANGYGKIDVSAAIAYPTSHGQNKWWDQRLKRTPYRRYEL